MSPLSIRFPMDYTKKCIKLLESIEFHFQTNLLFVDHILLSILQLENILNLIRWRLQEKRVNWHVGCSGNSWKLNRSNICSHIWNHANIAHKLCLGRASKKSS